MSESDTDSRSSGSNSESHCSDDEEEKIRIFGRGYEDDDEEEDEESDREEMAVALSPCQVTSMKPSAHENAMSVIQRANKCTVFNGSHVVNTYQQISPDMHNQFINQGSEFIKTEVKRHKPLFVETNGTRECIDVIESENAIVITGIPGEGKTTTAIMIINKLMRQGYKAIIVTSPEEWNNKVVQADESEKLVLLIDDMFGKVGVDEHRVNEWLAINEVVTQHLENKKGSVKIICTVRKKIYNATKQRLRKFRWFRTFRVVDISAERYAMSENEKVQLLQKYFKHYNIPKESRCTQAAQYNPPHGFPHCAELYCTEPHCRRMGIAFFVSPMPAVESEIQILYEKGSTQYYALLLVHLSPDQKLSVESLSGEQEFDETLLNKTRLLSKIETKDGMVIVRAVEKLTDIYLKEDDDGSVGFKHDSISEMIGVIATRNSPIPAVNYLSLQFLAEKTKYVSYKEKDKDEIAILPKKTTSRLVVRLTEALLNGEAFAACKHHAWDNIDFLNKWLDHVKNTESKQIEGNTLLDDFMTTPIETYHVMQRNYTSRPEEIQVNLLFLLYLNKKDTAKQEIEMVYNKQAMEESIRLSKFKREIRCPSGRKLKHPSNTEKYVGMIGKI